MKKHLAISFLAFSFVLNYSGFAQSWHALNGPNGSGAICSLITYEQGEIYSILPSGKVYYSNDKGKNWTEISSGLDNIEFTSSAKIKESPTGDIYLSTTKNFYIYFKSSSRWIEINTPTEEIFDFAFSPIGRNIYIASTQGLYVASNSYVFKLTQPWNYTSGELIILGNNNNFINNYMVISSEVLQFDDYGKNFKVIKTSECCSKLLFHKKSNALILSGNNIMEISKDFGQTWQNFPIPVNEFSFKVCTELADGSLISIGNYIYQSLDNGLTWNKIEDYGFFNLISFDYTSLISVSKNNEIVANGMSGNSVLLTLNKEIKLLKVELLEQKIYDFVQFGKSSIYCQAFIGKMFSNDDGNTWNSVNESRVDNVILFHDGDFALTNLDSIKVYNNQAQLMHTASIPPLGSVLDIVVDDHGTMIYITLLGTYYSTDKGITWIYNGRSNVDPSSLTSLKISKQNILYAYNNDIVYYSVDYGRRWNTIISPLNIIQSVVLSANNVFYMTGYEQAQNSNEKNVFFTKDFGITMDSFTVKITEFYGLVDEYDNIYYGRNIQNELKIYNNLTKETKTLSSNGLPDNIFNFVLYRGENDYFYCLKNKVPIYKFSQKQEIHTGTIYGKVIIDQNQNCVLDNNEKTYTDFELQIKGPNTIYQIPVQKDGTFEVTVNSDQYEISLISKSLSWTECNFPKNISVTTNNKTNLNELLVKPIELCPDLNTTVNYGNLRRCFDANYISISVQNNGTQEATNTKLEVIMDDYFENIQSTIPPKSVDGNIWYFEIPHIGIGETFRIKLQVKISCNATINQIHCIKVNTKNDKKCNTFLPSIDTLFACEKNLGSFDPNNKVAYINGVPDITKINPEQAIDYLIRFQNTGTDTAFTIVLKDKLDYNLDWSSFKPVSSSHNYNYQIDAVGNLKVTYPNIMLADSNVNEANSHGFFRYNIKPKSGLPLGSIINNNANIYFDYNNFVLTNNVLIRVQKITNTNYASNTTSELLAIPNPFNESTTIELPEILKGKLNIFLTNIHGTNVKKFILKDHKIIIHRDNLPSGMYFIIAIDQHGNKAFGKLMIE